MNNDPRFTESEWERAKAEMLDILQNRAASRGMITYGDLSRCVCSVQIGPHDPAMGKMLGQISEEENLKGRGMLSVIVVHKDGDMEPGNGFYELASELGKDVSDRVKLWVTELHKVHDCWANSRSK